MSLNRILQSAQQLGMPVVITDRDGANAQVVLPFDDFMALTGAVQGEKRGMASGSLEDLDLAGEADVDDEAEWNLSGFDRSDMGEVSAQDPFDFTVEAPDVQLEEESQSSKELGGMDEKFYLEPLDDAGSIK